MIQLQPKNGFLPINSRKAVLLSAVVAVERNNVSADLLVDINSNFGFYHAQGPYAEAWLRYVGLEADNV